MDKLSQLHGSPISGEGLQVHKGDQRGRRDGLLLRACLGGFVLDVFVH